MLEHPPLAQDHRVKLGNILGQLRENPDEIAPRSSNFRHVASIQAKRVSTWRAILNFYGLCPWKLMGGRPRAAATLFAASPTSASFHPTFTLDSGE
jgi:hypothetical protein